MCWLFDISNRLELYKSEISYEYRRFTFLYRHTHISRWIFIIGYGFDAWNKLKAGVILSTPFKWRSTEKIAQHRHVKWAIFKLFDDERTYANMWAARIGAFGKYDNECRTDLRGERKSLVGKKCVVLMVHDTCQSVHLYFPSFDPQATKEKCVYFKLNACADVHQVDSICSLICWYICQYYHSPHFTPEQLEHVTEMKASVPMCEFTRTLVINTKYEI